MSLTRLLVLLFIIIVVVVEFNFYSFYDKVILNKVNLNKKFIYTNRKTKHNSSSVLWECPIYVYKNTNYTSQANEDKYVINYFIQNKMNPFNRIYLEIGAFDGYDMSNTYALEHGYGWRGLLIEAGPLTYQRLLKTDRPRSIKLNNAVCSEEGFIEYIDNPWGRGGLKKFRDNSFYGNKKVKIKCYPISKLIRDNGIRYIDLFSLDVEGAEENLLKTFDWNIPVRIWIIEVNALKIGGSVEEKERCINVQNMLKDHGYIYMGISANNSVNVFYYDPTFDDKIKLFKQEESDIYNEKNCG